MPAHETYIEPCMGSAEVFFCKPPSQLEIQKEATLGTFDILLVFMFDRLGRKDDETPFVLEWLHSNGIEVWSAEEE